MSVLSLVLRLSEWSMAVATDRCSRWHRKDAGVVDEIPGAYKSLESVIEAQTDLVEVVARLRTLMCVKG